MRQYAFPRKEHLRKNADFLNVFTNPGICIDAERLSVRIKKNELSHNRIGFAVSKKRYKKSVNRNRIKRLLREAYRKNRHLFSLTGYDMVWVSSTLVPLMKAAEVEKIVQHCLKKARATHERLHANTHKDI